ncbi:response regulator [Magnetospirillum sp. SS-4]|uniref:response regulator n=1 Tax=Magnetospirillum sp. SS-4 TaxID=2681465 RepID=UPI00137E8071
MVVQVVDDSDVNLFVMASMVRKLGHVAELHSDPIAALAACRSGIPDLIIVDFMMPEMDGIQYTRSIRQTEAGRLVPIVLVTASHDPTVEGRAMDAGANAFLTKPLRFPDLKEVVDALLPDRNRDGAP